MNREDIIRMAKEAGFEVLLPSEEVFGRGGVYTGSDDEISKYLERFAALVASAEHKRVQQVYTDAATDSVKAAIAYEREACAKVCESIDMEAFGVLPVRTVMITNHCAKAIRARGQA